MIDKKKQKKTSEAKIAANRENAKRSTGPRTEEGKRKASLNSYKHGMFSSQLFSNSKHWIDDRNFYENFYSGLREHYSPEGFLENLYLERISVELFRIWRSQIHEQFLLGDKFGFCGNSINNFIRYESAATRRLEKLTDELKDLQAKRQSEAESDGQSDSLSDPGDRDEDSCDSPHSIDEIEACSETAVAGRDEMASVCLDQATVALDLVGGFCELPNLDCVENDKTNPKGASQSLPIADPLAAHANEIGLPEERCSYGDGANTWKLESEETKPNEPSECKQVAEPLAASGNEIVPVGEYSTCYCNTSEMPEGVPTREDGIKSENDGTKSNERSECMLPPEPVTPNGSEVAAIEGPRHNSNTSKALGSVAIPENCVKFDNDETKPREPYETMSQGESSIQILSNSDD
ncbi:MAG TPA: hypothetical protein VG322_00605 [Candidatus Acidoferrales bacterium]|jgi:hypothetical protein|nr:hypothetical protein [Candidatus Acidoferrales bacterium]